MLLPPELLLLLLPLQLLLLLLRPLLDMCSLGCSGLLLLLQLLLLLLVLLLLLLQLKVLPNTRLVLSHLLRGRKRAISIRIVLVP